VARAVGAAILALALTTATAPLVPAAAKPARFRALDVLRGATVALMIVVNNPGSWGALYPPLGHAAWHGLTPTDLVFPFFLFAVGNALAFVMPGYRALTLTAFHARVARRALLIFGIGLLLNAAPFVRHDGSGALVMKDWDTLRVMGVLQRIALAWAAAALILRFTPSLRAVLAWAAGLLLAYWAACVVWGAPGDPYSLAGYFGTALDRQLLGAGHLYRGEGVPFDPEGLASTLPAIAQVLIGWVAGEWLRREPPRHETVTRLFMAALALGLLGYLWSLVMPVNKKIWTSSYVLLTSALAFALLAALVVLIDLRADPVAGAPGRRHRWMDFCEVFGRNALFVYAMSGLIPRFQGLLRWPAPAAADGGLRWYTPWDWAWQQLFAPLFADARLGSLLMALANLLLYWALAEFMHRRRWYLRV
jgi:predicted acyltransferase